MSRAIATIVAFSIIIFASCPTLTRADQPNAESKPAEAKDPKRTTTNWLKWPALAINDPDTQPAELGSEVEGDADVVYGSRFLSERPCGSSPVHRLGNGLLTMASNLMTGLRLTDMETCYKAFRRNVLRGLTIKQNRFGFEPEITAKIARRRQRVCEVPIRYHARDWKEGKKIGLADALNALYCIARYSWID